MGARPSLTTWRRESLTPCLRVPKWPYAPNWPPECALATAPVGLMTMLSAPMATTAEINVRNLFLLNSLPPNYQIANFRIFQMSHRVNGSDSAALALMMPKILSAEMPMDVCDICATAGHFCVTSVELIPVGHSVSSRGCYDLASFYALVTLFRLPTVGAIRNWGLGMAKGGILRSLLLASCFGVLGGAAYGAPFTINDALRMAVQTNPSIGEAAANKRATEAELRQTQSTLLPQVRLEASAGPEKLNNPATFPLNSITPTLNNGQWVAGAQD